MKLEAGDKVTFKKSADLKGYKFFKHIKKNKVYTVAKVKRGGGIVLSEIDIGVNIFGEEQGFVADRFKKAIRQ